MNVFGVILLCIAALGYMSIGSRFMRAKGVMVHHAAIMSYDGVEVDEVHDRVFRALYRVTGGLSISVGVALFALAIFPVARDELWASFVILMICATTSYGGCLLQYRIEQRTGVRMVWRPAAVVQVMILFGLLLS